MQAREILKVKPEGNYVVHQGLAPPIPTPTSCSRARWRCSSPPSTRARSRMVGEAYTDGWLPGERAAEHGAVPDQEQQQGRCGDRRQRRHRRRRHRGARGARASRARCRSPARTPTRPRSTGSRSAPRPSRSSRMRASSAATPRRSPCRWPGARSSARSRAPSRGTSDPRSRRCRALFLTPVPITQGQPERRHRRRLGHARTWSARA